MSSFLTDAEKALLAAELVPLAETFERDIVIYSEAEKTIISTDANYNRFQSNDLGLNSQNPTNTPVRNVVRARIMYEKRQPNGYLEAYGYGKDVNQTKLNNLEGLVRIKVGTAGNALIAGSKLIEFDGAMFQIDGSTRPHGLFDNQYYTFYLKKTQ